MLKNEEVLNAIDTSKAKCTLPSGKETGQVDGE